MSDAGDRTDRDIPIGEAQSLGLTPDAAGVLPSDDVSADPEWAIVDAEALMGAIEKWSDGRERDLSALKIGVATETHKSGDEVPQLLIEDYYDGEETVVVCGLREVDS